MSGDEGASQSDFGRRHFGLLGVPTTAPRRSTGDRDLTVFSSFTIRLRTMNQTGDACSRLKTMVLRQTGEVLRRPTLGNPCL